MVHSPRDTIDNGPPAESETGRDPHQGDLYFFPEQRVSEGHVRSILRQGSAKERAWVVSHLLRYAVWDDIWGYVSRDQVRDIFPQLDLPENLRTAWARMLKLEEPVPG